MVLIIVPIVLFVYKLLLPSRIMYYFLCHMSIIDTLKQRYPYLKNDITEEILWWNIFKADHTK